MYLNRTVVVGLTLLAMMTIAGVDRASGQEPATLPAVAEAANEDGATAPETRPPTGSAAVAAESGIARGSGPDELREPGEFQTGDRILLSVTGIEELSDTFTVRVGPVLDLPGIGPVSLADATRSEIEPYLRAHLGRLIRDPEVRALALLRVAVAGHVNQPGYYDLPAQALLTDALMIAGGPTRDAELTRVWIERGRARILDGAALQEAIARSRTLDDLELRTGDRLIVPERAKLTSDEWARLGIVALPTIVLVVRELF